MRTRALVALGLIAALSGCSPQPAADMSCDEAVASTTPIEPLGEGIEILVSLDLAQSLHHCESLDDWRAALREHPDVVGAESISDEDSMAYVAGSCGLLLDSGAESRICTEAREAGLIG